MIAVDASALVAYLLAEPGVLDIRQALLSVPSGSCRVAPVNWLEARIVAERHNKSGAFDDMLAAYAIAIHPTDAAQAEIAWDAFRRYGKGRHKAALNLADCFAYALARALAAPLLYVGRVFCAPIYAQRLENKPDFA